MTQRPNINIRFDTKTQVERIRRAAKLRKWSFNQFVVDATHKEADKILTAEKPEQLTVGADQPSLNQ
jgi:uncharacterized protein (DUF1778 family)